MEVKLATFLPIDSMNTSLQAKLSELRVYVSSSADGDLPLWGRLQLWKSMRAYYGKEASLRRSYMAIYTCDRLLPRWERADIPQQYLALPRTVCAIARHFLAGIVSKRSVVALSGDYSRINEDCISQCNWEQRGNVVFLYYGAYYLLLRVINRDDAMYKRRGLYSECESSDVSLRPKEDDYADPSLWDTYYVASLVSAEDAGRVELNENEARRQFWTNWLDDVVPRFCGDIDDARKLACA
jgi:immunity protein Imm5 of predicted polymorphic toxin system